MKTMSRWSARGACAAAGLGMLLGGHGVAAAAGKANSFGVGFIAGEPTGVSAKLWLDGTRAIDMAAAWSLVDEEALHLHADYVLHDFSPIHVDRGQLPLYYGIGGRVKFADDARLGMRGVFGLNYIFDGPPLDAFIEIVPLLDLVPGTDLNFNASFGMRFFFQ